MADIDEYGRMMLSATDQVPREGWAYIEGVDIDHGLIFARRSAARQWANLRTETRPNIIKVTVKGLDVRPA